MFDGALPAELYPHYGAGSWTRTNDIRLGRLNFLIHKLAVCAFFLYYNYNKFFKNCQESAFRLEQLFFLCVAVREYKFSVFYNQNIHFYLDNPNSYRYHTNNTREAEGAVCDA